MEYVDTSRLGDHITYISDLRHLRADYPHWEITRSLGRHLPGAQPIAKRIWKSRPRAAWIRLESTLTAAARAEEVVVLAAFSVAYLAITRRAGVVRSSSGTTSSSPCIRPDSRPIRTSGPCSPAALEQMPPTFHILSRMFLRVFGVNPLALRLPEILGVGVMSLCLFVIVSRRSSAVYGLVAMVLPARHARLYYATEARPYGLVLGCAALSLCWQSVADDRRRLSLSLGLTASLAAALASHYYAVLIFVPLAAGEVARTIVRRRLDPWVWLAFAHGYDSALGVPASDSIRP